MLDFFQYGFIKNALCAGILASIICGIIGTYVVTKKIVSISGGISHAAFGGIGLGYFLGVNPIWVAIIFTLFTALLIGIITRKTKQNEDSLVGIIWALGMSIGIIFISLTPGYAPDLMSYLFGNILTVPFEDIILMLILNVIIIIFVFLFYKEFLSLIFDEEFSKIIGVPVDFLYFLLLCLIALTVVILIKIVGIILVISLLTIPATISKQFTYNLKKMMILSIFLGIIFTVLGLYLSYLFNLPSGATIILLSGSVFLVTSLYKKLY